MDRWNTATGKTTLARLIAKYLHAFGVLPLDRFVEKNGLEMKGKFAGHTTHTVKEAIKDAMGGCLFLDEAATRTHIYSALLHMQQHPGAAPSR